MARVITNQDGAAVSISFGNYESAQFPTFPESISHAQINPLLLENLSDTIVCDLDGDSYRLQEPSCLFKDFAHFFDDVLEEDTIPSSEFYRPEITAKRLYDNQDLWHVLLLVNDIYSITKYNQPTIKYIPGSELHRLAKFTERAERNVRALKDADLNDVIV